MHDAGKPVLRLEDGLESGLFEMMIRSQRIRHSVLAHHYEGDTVRRGPSLVGSLAIQLQSPLPQVQLGPHNVGAAVGLDCVRDRVPYRAD